MFRVKEGELVRVDSVQVVGPRAMQTDRVLDIFNVKAGSALVQRRIEDGLGALLSFLRGERVSLLRFVSRGRHPARSGFRTGSRSDFRRPFCPD